MNKFNAVAFAVAGAFLVPCNAASAGQIYSIDPTQSYVKAYTPTWVLSSYTYSLSEDGQFISTPTWQTQWNLTSFALSGSFVRSTEWSPWAPNLGHFTIDQMRFNVSTPSSISFSPPPQLTFYESTGVVVDYGAPCVLDPFYGPPPIGWACTGFSTGFPAYVAGVIDGRAFDVQGGSGGVPVLFFATYTGEGPAPSISLDLYPKQYSYRIVAAAVPEPTTLWLLCLGGFFVWGFSRWYIKPGKHEKVKRQAVTRAD